MNEYQPENLIVSRLLKEIQPHQKIALGAGLPQLLRPYLPSSCSAFDISEVSGPVDLAIVEASEVSSTGDLIARNGQFPSLEAKHWIAALRCDQRDRFCLLDKCRQPVDCHGCIELIVTELGVLRITDVGFELQELAPGRASDDVRKRVHASLHVADDLRVMEL